MNKLTTPSLPKLEPESVKYDICKYCTNEKQLQETEYSCALTTIRISENIMTVYDYELDADELKLERIDVNGNYYPENCKWIPFKEQALNKRINKNNKSGYPGVCYHKRTKMYRVTGRSHGNNKNIGSFKFLKDAIEARREFELEEYGKYLYDLKSEWNALGINEDNAVFELVE